MVQIIISGYARISIHALLAESDANNQPERQAQRISIHALLAESDARRDSRQQPAGISIHALLAESDKRSFATSAPVSISIHALLAESDLLTAQRGSRPLFISIHALLAESDLRAQKTAYTMPLFLSTLSLRRATLQRPAFSSPCRNFYPRSPCGERPIALVNTASDNIISIHALLAESDG